MANLFGNPDSKLRTLNEKAYNVFDYVASEAQMHDGYAKFDSKQGYIPLVVEILDSHDTGLWNIRRVSLSHYGEQNGDLMADPDMEFLWYHNAINEEDSFVMPISYQNDYAQFYQQSLHYDENLAPTKVCTKMQEEHVDFCDMWFSNIVDQQNIPCEMPQEI